MKSHYQHRWYEGSYTFEKSRKRWKWAGRYRTEDGEARKILAGQSGVDDRIPLELRVKEWLKKIDSRTGKLCISNERDLKLSEWSKEWLGLIKGTVKNSTYNYYKYFVDCYINTSELSNKKLKDIKTIQIQNFINKLAVSKGRKTDKLSASTINKLRNVLRTIFKAAIDNEELHGKNVVLKVKFVKGSKRKPVALTKKQIHSFLKIAKNGSYLKKDVKEENNTNINDLWKIYNIRCYFALLETMFTTGMRIGEALSLKWENVDLKNKSINIVSTLTSKNEVGTPKTERSARVNFLTNDVAKLLVVWQKEQAKFAKDFGIKDFKKYDFVFANTRGSSISYRNFLRRCWRPIRDKANLGKITPHSIRHTFVSQLINSQVPIKLVAELVGDKVEMIIGTYTHTLPEARKQAIAKVTKIYSDKTEKKEGGAA